MNTTLYKIINSTIDKHEGGFVNHKYDKGGATNWGITQATYSRYLGRQATLTEMKDMPKEIAVKIYEMYYLNSHNLNLLPEELFHIAFDLHVNHSPNAAGRMIQASLKELGADLVIDGRIGPNTAKEAKKIMDKYPLMDVINKICDRRQAYYNSLVSKNPTQKVFIRGWTNRADWFRKQSNLIIPSESKPTAVVKKDEPEPKEIKLSFWQRLLKYINGETKHV